MAPFSRNQSIGLSVLGTRCFEEHELRLGFGVFGFEGSRITQNDRTHLLQHSHRANVTRSNVQDHDLFWVNTQVHDSRLRQLGLRRGHLERQQTDRYQMHQTQTFVHLTSLFSTVFLPSGSIPTSRREVVLIVQTYAITSELR